MAVSAVHRKWVKVEFEKMMVAAVLLTMLQGKARPKALPTIELYQGFAIVRDGLLVDRAPLAPATPAPRLSVSYRRDETFAVWDERGLTVRIGKRIFSTRLDEIAVSQRAQTADAIRDTVEKLRTGDRQKGASALSGSCRLGTMAYFLVRWVDKQGEPWLEALVSVDLAKDNLHPKLVGRFQGFSTAAQPIDQLLVPLEGKLTVFTRDTKEWGRATYDVATDSFGFDPLGAKLQSLSPAGFFVEKAEYGLNIAGKIDRVTLDRQTYVESRNPLRFLDDLTPPIISEPGIIHNGGTGAVAAVPKDIGITRVSDFVVLFSPAIKPTSAYLYRAENWKLFDKTGR